MSSLPSRPAALLPLLSVALNFAACSEPGSASSNSLSGGRSSNSGGGAGGSAGQGGNSSGNASAAGARISSGGAATNAGAPSAAGGVTSAGAGGTAAAGAGSSNAGASSGGAAGASAALPDLPWVQGTCANPSNALNFETAEFCVSLNKASQTVVALKPKAAKDFDFTPADLVNTRSGTGYFHLGDITLRLRPASGGGDWQNVTTSASRTSVTALSTSASVLASAELGPELPANLPLAITRSWRLEGGRLSMQFDLKNKSSTAVQIGALGLPMVFNNVLTGRTLEQAHKTCSFADPYLGRDAGYLQVTRLNGAGPALLVLPWGRTPFEAYNPILNAPKAGSKDPVAVFTDLTPRAQTFEGFLEWMVYSKAYAEREWASAKPWNTASDLVLAPSETKSIGLSFVLSDQIRNIEKTLLANRRPLAAAVPGYILPSDIEGKLFLNNAAPVQSIDVEPSDALSLKPAPDTSAGWKSFSVAAKAWGRARLSVNYADGTTQTIHYYVTKPASQAVSDLGAFLTTKAWFVDEKDPFGRSPSVMTYDHELATVVTQSRQAWVCGLGDDGGATWLAGIMKLLGQPDAAQVAKYEQFIDQVVWGGLQYSSGSQQYGVKRTLFYYEPTSMPTGYYSSNVQWTDANSGQTYWGAWSKAHTLEVPRSYNYPHVAALYWVMYRLARNNNGLVSSHTWDWYLEQARRTALAMTTIGNEYANYGLMDGSVFVEILKDLKREGQSANASELESKMKARATTWNGQAYPFGSEMPWDSTGQEEVYAWTRYFGFSAKAKVCVDAITGYMPSIPHWGYDGCARRYWDFLYGGSKTDRLERMIHHYGSSLNALPILTEFRDHPEDLYLLRIGYAGMLGSLSNIDQDGFPSMAFHTFPDTLKWDPISGDYGLNFFGHALNAATYLVQHPEFGWQAYGGNVSLNGNVVSVTPLDAFRQRIYIAPMGLFVTLDAGRFEKLEFDSVAGSATFTLAPKDVYAQQARLRLEQSAGSGKAYALQGSFTKERDASVVPLGAGATTITIR